MFFCLQILRLGLFKVINTRMREDLSLLILNLVSANTLSGMNKKIATPRRYAIATRHGWPYANKIHTGERYIPSIPHLMKFCRFRFKG